MVTRRRDQEPQRLARQVRGRTGTGGAYPRVRLFRSDALERLTVLTPRTFVATWAVVLPVVVLAGRNAVGPLAWIGLVLAGLLVWSLFEYAMHRFVFHLEPRAAIGRRMAFVMHGNHHGDPGDPDRSLMPLIVSLPWSGAIWGLFFLLLGQAGSVAFLGFAAGYVIYDAVHYACHQLPVKGRLLRALRRHHLRHHFGQADGDYAITAIFWDRVFGSRIPDKAAASGRRA